MGVNGAKFGIPVLAAALSSCVVFEVVDLILSWSWGVVFHFIFLNDIDGIAVEGVFLGHARLHLILILYEGGDTLPTPGCLWIWGTR